MNRRHFIQKTAIGLTIPTIALGSKKARKTHIITFSFDDGFSKSFDKLADIHEEFGLKACFNVIASGHLPSFKAVDEWILPELMGNFEQWNALAARGHEVMPHSWNHVNHAQIEVQEAKDLILKCLQYFDENLTGYKSSKAVFNFPFNSSTDELDQFTLQHVRAVRTSGQGAIKPFPDKNTNRVLGCSSHGPTLSDDWVDEKVNSFLSTSGGWLILNLHGLDNEGWGPVSTGYFTALLKKLVDVETLDILPAGMVLEKYAS